MLERILKSTAAVLIACLLLPGCSHFSSRARKQAAYQKYIRQHMTAQAKLRAKRRAQYQAKSKLHKMPKPSEPSEEKVTAETGSGPQSVTSVQPQGSE